MDSLLTDPRRMPLGLALLIGVQAVCVAFFLGDVLEDFREMAPGGGFHIGIEAFAALSLLAAIVLEVRVLLGLLRRKAQLEHSLTLTRAAVHEVIEAHFDVWRLSASERDVAGFLVKGLGIPEIAELRGCAEGTVKAHLNAIYRKSGARNRGELLSLVIDSLIDGRGAGGEVTPSALRERAG